MVRKSRETSIPASSSCDQLLPDSIADAPNEEEDEEEKFEDARDEEEKDVFFKLDDGASAETSAASPSTITRYLPFHHISSDQRINPFSRNPVRVYADGIYDLFHLGHARSLEQAKKLFPNTYLLVGCCGDAITQKYKGKTVMSETERYESLRHCKWVDEVIPDAPWLITQEFLEKHQIDFVAHDALPYAGSDGNKDVYEFVKAAGKFKETKRTDGISTSDIIMRILKNRNEYVKRNLARGYSRNDLGVSYVQEKQLRVNMGITKLRQKIKERQQKLNIVARLRHEWVLSGFLDKFQETSRSVSSFKSFKDEPYWLPRCALRSIPFK